MKVKNKKNVAKVLSVISKTHQIKRNKIKRLADKKGKKKKKISKKVLIEAGIKPDLKKPKISTEKPSATDSLSKLTNVSYKGTPTNSIPSIHRPQKKFDGDKNQTSFLKRMRDRLKSARFR